MGENVYINGKELYETFLRVLLNHGVKEDDANSIATIFTHNAADGVLSHSVNRFARMVDYLDRGIIKNGVWPKLISASETIEKWDAGFGFGVISASFCMNRAIEIASKHGVGIAVALHSNHWMRPGYYGWTAADKGFIGVCMTTTRRNLVPWGGTDPQLGNNPLVIAVPRKKGNLVFDSSMAQFSWGRIKEYSSEGRKLPTIGGYDSQGNPTDDAAEIEKSFLAMPAGFWKGSALSILLEAVACSLSQGNSIGDNDIYGDVETNMTQIFMAIDPKVVNENYSEDNLDRIVERLHNCPSKDGKTRVRYPGEKALVTRMKSEKNGIEIPKRSWENLKALQ